jgi:RimJ/RimL family protein N-acetyltransferase
MKPVTLTGEGLHLRPWQLSDVDDLARACDDPLTARFLPHIPSPYTTESARWWITEGAPAAWEAGGCSFAVTDPADGGLLGGAGMSASSTHRKHAEIGYWVAPWARGRGVATAATRVLSAWGFGNGVERMELLAAKENVPSQRVALAAGFAREGVRRGASLGRDGVRTDLIAFVRMHNDPPGPISRFLPDLADGQLTDGVVRLRPLAPDDVDDIFALFQLPEVAQSYYGPPMTREVALRRCATAASSWLAGERAELVITDASTGAFAGDMGMQVHDPFLSQAMIGYSLHPEFRGRGFATRGARLITDWAFSIGIVRVIAGTAPENEASQRVLQRAGFEREAYFKAALPGRDGKRVDDIQWVRISPTL